MPRSAAACAGAACRGCPRWRESRSGALSGWIPTASRRFCRSGRCPASARRDHGRDGEERERDQKTGRMSSLSRCSLVTSRRRAPDGTNVSQALKKSAKGTSAIRLTPAAVPPQVDSGSHEADEEHRPKCGPSTRADLVLEIHMNLIALALRIEEV